MAHLGRKGREDRMRVKNRSGESVEVSYDKIKERLIELCRRGGKKKTSAASSDIEKEEATNARHILDVDVDVVVIETIKGIYDGITTSQLDDMSARVCVSLQNKDHAYDILAGRISMSNIHKMIGCLLSLPHDSYAPFSNKVAFIEERVPGTYNASFLAFVNEHASRLDAMFDYERDYNYNYFSVRTMEHGYLMQVDGTCVESPQDMWMRVAVAVNCGDHGDPDADFTLGRIRTCYDAMSTGLFTHATPTLFNAGTRFEQLSSCYLLGIQDSLEGIYGTLADCAQISKWAGGIGVHVSNVRAEGSRISSTNGKSDGIIPMLKVFNETARYCNQSGRRKGSIAIYLEPWHADVWKFVELRKNIGAESERARDLFLALWIPDLFMRRVAEEGDWYLMSPDACPGLQDVHGPEFDRLYESYVTSGKYVRKVKAKALWQHVIQCQMETGTPYVLYKDNVNAMCNQKNLGTIKSSNLCAEITEYSDHQTYAVCNLASIAVNRYVKGAWAPVESYTDTVTSPSGKATQHTATRRPGMHFDHTALHEVAKLITYNLNRIIDTNFYPTPETRSSNMDARPIGIGVQGFADLYCALGLEYESEEALQLDAEVMETIYHGALEASVELAKLYGPYPRFRGSPFSKGKLQMDLWDEEMRKSEHKTHRPVRFSRRWDWDAMRAAVREHGTRNSMLTALMPTATTSQILGNSECFEPYHSNAFKRTTLSGEFLVVNKALMRDMMDAGAWKEAETMQYLIRKDGSVQDMEGLPDVMKRMYRTVWEVPQKSLMDHALARAPFVDQSQSMNLFFSTPNSRKLYSALLYAWKNGLKTGMYYLRSNPASEALRTGVNGTTTGTGTNRKKTASALAPAPALLPADSDSNPNTPNRPTPSAPACSLRNDGICEMCSS